MSDKSQSVGDAPRKLVSEGKLDIVATAKLVTAVRKAVAAMP
jgi:hypothetical protein